MPSSKIIILGKITKSIPRVFKSKSLSNAPSPNFSVSQSYISNLCKFLSENWNPSSNGLTFNNFCKVPAALSKELNIISRYFSILYLIISFSILILSTYILNFLKPSSSISSILLLYDGSVLFISNFGSKGSGLIFILFVPQRYGLVLFALILLIKKIRLIIKEMILPFIFLLYKHLFIN